MTRISPVLAISAVLFIFSFTSCRKTIPGDKSTNSTDPVPATFAYTVAERFDPSVFSEQKSNLPPKSLNGIMNMVEIRGEDNEPVIYVFNYRAGGFLMLSADFQVQPVLAWVDKGEFSEGERPAGFSNWLNRTKENFYVLQHGLYDNCSAAMAAWRGYVQQNKVPVPSSLAGKFAPPPVEPGGGTGGCDFPEDGYYVQTVGPLLQVTWGQGCSYNELCDPGNIYNCNNGCFSLRPLTGCAATAMAQVMRFYQFPATYSYATMPLNEGNDAVQQLMSDAGASVNTTYGCSFSSAPGSNIPTAFKNNFGYSSANRNAYSMNSDYFRIVTNINHHWPVILEGEDPNITNGGHGWVCDGYERVTYTTCHSSFSMLSFHMNWGWHERVLNSTNGPDYNGWYAFDNWYIPGRNWNFSYTTYSTTEIHP